nr:hypothetical protein [uncultured Flavobacterium sp.]
MQQAIFIIMPDMLGENSLFQNINFVQLAQMSDNQDEIIYLYDLQGFIDAFNSSNLNRMDY